MAGTGNSIERSTPFAYGVALLLTLTAFGLTALSWPWLERTPLALLFAAVSLVAWYGGQGPGLLAAVLATALSNFYLLPPYRRVSFGPSELLSGVVLLALPVLITSVTASQRRLDRSRALASTWFRSTLASIGDAVIATDAEGRVIFMNAVAERLTGWTTADAQGKPLREIFVIVNERTRAPVENPVEKVLRVGDIVGLANHTVLIAKDGTEVPIDDSAAPIRRSTGETDGVVLVFRDIAERRRAELFMKHLAAIVQSSDDIIASKTLDGIITSWNKGAEQTLGYAADEIVGKHVSMLIPPEQIEDVEAILSRLRRGEKVDHFLTKRRRKDGTIIDVDLTVSPIRDEEGHVIGASKVGRDVTERRRAQEVKERLAAIVDSSDDIIASTTLDGTITSWNNGAERILGYRPDEVIGRHVSMLMPIEHLEDTEAILGRIRRGEKVDHYLTRRKRKDGSIIDVALTVSPIRDASGRIVGASKIGRDVTREKLMDAERRDAERRKDEFLAMLSHELRNPLSAIRSALDLYRRGATEHDREWAIDVVARQTRQLGYLIDDLLDLSRITQNKIQLKTQVIDVSPIIQHAIEATRPQVQERRQTITWAAPTEHLAVNADPFRLEQVVVNLLTNAVKYTEPGGQIWIDAACENDQVVIRVRDTGIGIPPELLPRLFELFAQGERSLARSEGGLGIGLTLVKVLTEMHHGNVTASSPGVGQGSEFVVRLPQVAGVIPPSEAAPPAPAEPKRRHGRVLIVDDNVDTAKSVGRLLKLSGYEIRTAFDGREAINLAREYRPEVVLLDIGLPVVDGYQVAATLRHEGCCNGAMFIATTGYGDERDRLKTREAGFDAHFVKPLDFDALLAAIARRRSG